MYTRFHWTSEMTRLTAATWLCSLGLCAGSCAPATGGGYVPVIRFQTRELRGATSSVEVFVVPVGDCAALAQSGLDPVSSARNVAFRINEPAEPLGFLPSGDVGLYARARNGQCRVVAAGCQVFTLSGNGSGELPVTIDAVARGCVCSVCTNGRCGQAAPDDAGPMAFVLYDNAIATPLRNESYMSGGGTAPPITVCDRTHAVSPPCSLQITLTQWGALRLSMAPSTVPTPCQTLEFELRTEAEPAGAFTVRLLDASGDALGEGTLSAAHITSRGADGWVHVAVDVDELNPANHLIAGAELQSHAPAATVINVDDVRLVARPCVQR
jgi:hypothetical protein